MENQITQNNDLIQILELKSIILGMKLQIKDNQDRLVKLEQNYIKRYNDISTQDDSQPDHKKLEFKYLKKLPDLDFV